MVPYRLEKMRPKLFVICSNMKPSIDLARMVCPWLY
jgi:hypothetical protein